MLIYQIDALIIIQKYYKLTKIIQATIINNQILCMLLKIIFNHLMIITFYT